MDGIIDIIIAVLFIAVPAIFKAIGNRLEKSGKAEKAGKFKKVAEAFENEPDKEDTFDGGTDDDRMMGEWLFDEKEEDDEPVELDPAPVVVMKPEVREIDIMDYIDKPETVVKRQIKHLPPQPSVKKTSFLIEDEPEKKGEKIDPKKLVIYSEIMKPKF